MLAVAVAVGGCGSSAGSATSAAHADPAAATPARASAFVSVLLKPTGTLRADTLTAAQKLSHLSDPFGALVAAIGRSAHHPVDFATQIKPWLGDRAGAFFAGSNGGSGRGSVGFGNGAGLAKGTLNGAVAALIVDTTSASKAQAFVRSQTASEGATQTSYRGVSYELERSNHSAVGTVGGYLVLGTEPGLRAVVDTVDGGAALAANGNYRSMAARTAGGLASAYLDIDELLRSIHSSNASTAQGLGLIRQGIATAGFQRIGLRFTPTPSALLLDGFVQPGHASTAAGGATGADALRALPGDAWLGLGLGNVGADLGHILQGISGATVRGINLGLALNTLAATSGINIQHDLLSWMGSGGIFVRGTTRAGLGGALVVQSHDRALSRAAVGKLGSLLAKVGLAVAPAHVAGSDAAIAVHSRTSLSAFRLLIADGQGRFTIAVGAAAAADALEPRSTLGRGAAIARAQAALGSGYQPSLLVDGPTLTALLRSLAGGANTGLARALPYFGSITALAAGTTPGVPNSGRLALGLR